MRRQLSSPERKKQKQFLGIANKGGLSRDSNRDRAAGSVIYLAGERPRKEEIFHEAFFAGRVALAF